MAETLTLNTQRLKDLIEARKAASASGSSDETLTFFEAIQQEPTMARPQWIDAELTSLATQWGMHNERSEWYGSFRPKYWRGPSSMSDPKIVHAPTGLSVSAAPPYGTASNTAGLSYSSPPPMPTSSTASGNMAGGSLFAQPATQGHSQAPHMTSPPAPTTHQQQQQQPVNPKTLKQPAYSRCPFGTFFEDADTLMVRMGS